MELCRGVTLLRFERRTYCLEGSCSIQLSYGAIVFVGMARFELAISCSQSRRDNRTTLHPVGLPLKKRLIFGAFCGEGGIRTPGTLIEYDSLANCWFQPLTHLSVVNVESTRSGVRNDVSLLIEIGCKNTNFLLSDQIFFVFCSAKRLYKILSY